MSEFRTYLGILKAVHAGTDLSTAAQAAGRALDTRGRGLVGYVLGNLQRAAPVDLMRAAVEARVCMLQVAQPTSRAGGGGMGWSRQALYLDLALENVVRQAAERGAGDKNAANMVGPLLENLCLSTVNNAELCYCLKAWQMLPSGALSGQPSRDEALRAMAIIDRLRRALSAISDHMSETVGPPATTIGRALSCEAWAVDLFSEEVVRGGPAFAVSLILSAAEPPLRAAGELGAWQVISPAHALGRVVVAPGLHEVQDTVFGTPTVLVCHRVTGEEEIPDGVVAVLTPDAPDVLSHVAVRARNLKTLFATCYEKEPMDALVAREGKMLEVRNTSRGKRNKGMYLSIYRHTHTHTHTHT